MGNIEVKCMNEYDFLNEFSDKTLYTGLMASEINLYAGEFIEAFNVSLPEDVRTFLRVTNGLYINGKVLFSMINDNVKELSPRATNRTRDIIGFNRYYRDITDIEDYIILGKDSISYFVYDIASEKYQVLTNGTLEVMSEYNSLGQMIREVFA
jgi:hypothetical protein